MEKDINKDMQARISGYEIMFDDALRLIEAKQTGDRLDALIDALSEYYRSPLWKEDYFADEAGLLPDDLKRGVLSQDGLYDLLDSYDELVSDKTCTETSRDSDAVNAPTPCFADLITSDKGEPK